MSGSAKKKVKIPTNLPRRPSKEDEEWVDARKKPKEDKEEMRRITLDIPVSIYSAMKHKIFDERITMAKYIRRLMETDLSK